MRGPIHNRQFNPATGRLKFKKRVYTVWVVPNKNKEWQPFYCHDCRNMIFKYQGDSVMEAPGGYPQDFPVEIACKNASCGRIIRIEKAVEQL